MLTRAGRTRRRPRLRTILLAVNLAILALPLGGVTALRLYESALVRQTESELLGQGAILAAAYRAALARTRAGRGATGDYGVPADPEWLPAEGRWHPRPAALDLAVDAVRPRPPHAKESAVPPDSAAATAGADIASIMQEAQASTLAGIRVVDFRGVVVASTAEEVGRSLGDREEVARALQGEAVSLLRERVSSEAGLVSISRAAKLRVFVALPVLDGRRVAGAVVLSRTPRSIGETLYAKRFHLLAGAGLLLVVVFLTALFTSLTVSRPVEAVVRQSERAARGERGAVAPLERPITREIARLSEAVATMARTLEERADYIRTFASQVSHEFKAPLTAIQGAVELLHDHADTMSSAERGVFLENLAADAKRLERLVRRLLELARADMAALGDERADLAAVLEATVARQRALGLEVALELDPGLTSAPMSAEALESVLTNLLDNARQHGGQAARVTIQAAMVASRDGARASIRIEDDGPGVSNGNATRVFEPFFTTARDRGGTPVSASPSSARCSTRMAARSPSYPRRVGRRSGSRFPWTSRLGPRPGVDPTIRPSASPIGWGPRIAHGSRRRAGSSFIARQSPIA